MKIFNKEISKRNFFIIPTMGIVYNSEIVALAFAVLCFKCSFTFWEKGGAE